MNCAEVRQCLLASERPDRPGVAESRHLAGCPACQTWLKRLVRLERRITELAVPASSPPAALFERLGEPALVRLPEQPSARVRGVREVGRQKLALATALAATLLVFTIAWWAVPPKPPARTVRDWRKIIDQHKAASPRAQAAALAGVADLMLDDAQEHADDAARVEKVADEFERLMRDDLIAAAEALPAAERAVVLAGLSKTESAAGKLAFEWKKRYPASAKSMDRIWQSAREAERRLRLLG